MYIDGHKIGSTKKNTSWSSTIPATSRLIAVDDNSTKGVGSIFISVSNGFQSNQQVLSRWKCSSDNEDVGWTKTNFDDEGWQDAVVTNNKKKKLLKSILKRFHNGQNVTGVLPIWITYGGGEGRVRFRGHLGEC